MPCSWAGDPCSLKPLDGAGLRSYRVASGGESGQPAFALVGKEPSLATEAEAGGGVVRRTKVFDRTASG